MADDDPVKIEAFGKMSLIEYYMILDKKIGEMKRQAAKAKK